MRIPLTINACSVVLANLGHHFYVYQGEAKGQVVGELPLEGLRAFIAVNEEYASIEATFVVPCDVAVDEATAFMFINSLQQQSQGLCRFIVQDGQVLAKSSMLTTESLTASHVQSWWQRCVAEIVWWYEQMSSYSVIAPNPEPFIPEHLQLHGDVLDVFNEKPAADDERFAAVTAERVAKCMLQLTGGMPEVRVDGSAQVVEASIGGQSLDIFVTDNELQFIMASSVGAYDDGRMQAFARAINQFHVIEPAPAAFVITLGENLGLYTCATVDTSVGFDDEALQSLLRNWGSYVYSFNERFFG